MEKITMHTLNGMMRLTVGVAVTAEQVHSSR